jgi:tetratricopeptide (TPR) repeat protein
MDIMNRENNGMDKRNTIIAVVILFLISFGVYANTLSNGFVYDDQNQVVENTWIRNPGSIPEIFSSEVWGFTPRERSNYYRPIMHLIFMAEYGIFGLSPAGFHLGNIVLNAGVVIMVFFVALAFFPGRVLLSLLMSLIFALHPIHTEAVAWVSGVTELSYALFVLLALYFYIKADGRKGWQYILSVASFVLALLSKEQAISLLVFIVSYDALFRKEHFRGALKRYLPYVAITGIYFLIRTIAVGGFVHTDKHAELSAFQYVINVFPLFAKYLVMLVLPVGLNVFHVFRPATSLFEPVTLGSIFLTGALLAGMIFSFKKDRKIFFSIILIVIPLIPALYIPALGLNVFTERYLYLPSVGFAFLIGAVIEHMKGINAQRVSAAVLLLVSVIYAAGTISRNAVWHNDFTLWNDAVRKSPDGAMSHYNLGLEYKKRGHTDKAISHFETALRLVPNFERARMELGLALAAKGFPDKAVEQFRSIIKQNPKNAEAYNNLGTVYGGIGMTEKAIEYFHEAIRLYPDYADAHNNLGIAYGSQQNFIAAIEHFERAVASNPDFFDAHYNLGVTFLRMGRVDEALSQLRIALALNPASPKTHMSLAASYEMKGLSEEARKHRKRARSLTDKEPRQ